MFLLPLRSHQRSKSGIRAETSAPVVLSNLLSINSPSAPSCGSEMSISAVLALFCQLSDWLDSCRLPRLPSYCTWSDSPPDSSGYYRTAWLIHQHCLNHLSLASGNHCQVIAFMPKTLPPADTGHVQVITTDAA